MHFKDLFKDLAQALFLRAISCIPLSEHSLYPKSHRKLIFSQRLLLTLAKTFSLAFLKIRPGGVFTAFLRFSKNQKLSTTFGVETVFAQRNA